MSEKPTPSSREARRKTVGEVVTVSRVPPVLSREKADYSFRIKARLPASEAYDRLEIFVVHHSNASAWKSEMSKTSQEQGPPAINQDWANGDRYRQID